MPKIEVYTFAELSDEVKKKKAEKAIIDGLFLSNYYDFDVPYVKEQGEEHAEKEGFFTVESEGIIYNTSHEEWYIFGQFDIKAMHAYLIAHDFTEDEYNFLLDEITYVDVRPYYGGYTYDYYCNGNMSHALENRFENVLDAWLEAQMSYINNLDVDMRSSYESIEWTLDALADLYADHYFTADGIDVGMLK